jgi:GAF domain-containing protein
VTSAPFPDAGRFARISRELMADPTPEVILQKVVDLAVETVDGCDFAGLSLRRGTGRVETPAASDPIVLRADELQYELDEGPCLDAIRVVDTFVIGDTSTERRWTRWAPHAADLGLRAVLSVPLATDLNVSGGLNLYSRTPNAYDEVAVDTARIYATHASTAIAHITEVEGLRTAMQTRHVIGMAQGMLMLRYGLNEEAAFQFLRRSSQDTNIKLRDVAAQVIADFRTTKE